MAFHVTRIPIGNRSARSSVLVCDRSACAAKQLSHQTAQPTIPGFVVISGVPVLSNGKALHRNRAGMDCEVIDLCQCLANMSRQRGDQVGGLDDRPQSKEARQLQNHLSLDVLAH